MTTKKLMTHSMHARSARTKFNVDRAADLPLRVLPDVETISLEIDHDYEVDCDPYNRKGQFCSDAPTPRKY